MKKSLLFFQNNVIKYIILFKMLRGKIKDLKLKIIEKNMNE